MPSPTPANGPRLRANVDLIGEDAHLFTEIAVALLRKSGKPPATVDIIRESIRCYARELEVTIDPPTA